MTLIFTPPFLEDLSAGKGKVRRIGLYGILLLLILPGRLWAQTPTPVWSVAMGAVSVQSGNAVAVDAAGNTYYTGGFTGTTDFDPGPGTTSIASNGLNDIFILKLDASGALVWVKTIGGTNADIGFDIQLDATGNIYVAGYFSATADFDPGPASYPVTLAGVQDAFVLKLDASGNFVWVKSVGGTGIDIVQRMKIDGSGNLYLSGTFQGTVDFDPGASASPLTSAGGDDVFVLKLDPSGNYLWAGNIGGTNAETVNGLDVDASGNVYFAGTFTGTADFDPGAGAHPITTPAAVNNAYLVKLNASGAFVWAGSIASTTANTVAKLGLDATGNLYAAGQYTGTADLDPGAGVSSSTAAGGTDIYALKLDGSGNLVWAKVIGGSSGETVSTLAADAAGNIYIAGGFASGATVDFDPGTGTAPLTGAGTVPNYLLKLDATGNYVYATQYVSGTSSRSVTDIKFNAGGDLYLTGGFQGSATFGSTTLTSVGATDIYSVKLSVTPLPLHLLGFEAWLDNQQVQLKWASADEQNVSRFEVQRSPDGNNFDTIGSVAAKNNVLTTNYGYNDQHPLSAKTWYRLRMVDFDGKFTYSPVRVVTGVGKAASIRVYPVPARDVLTISGLELAAGRGPISIHLYNQTGQLVKTGVLQPGSVYSLPVSQLARGTYILRLAGSNGYQSSQSILIQ